MQNELYSAHLHHMQATWTTVMTSAGVDALLVHAGTPMTSFRDDYVYSFRANPHFLAWLPLVRHPDCALLIRPDCRPLLWFYQPEDYWHLPPADPDNWWADHFDVRVTTEPEAWQRALPLPVERIAALGDAPALAAAFPAAALNPEPLISRLELLRTCKTSYEIQCMREANAEAAAAHRRAQAAFRDGCSEFDIHLAYLASCRASDEELPYHSIVALNEHSAVLHYQLRQRQAPPEQRAFLIDAGCAVNAYCSDITRTYAAQPGDFADLVEGMNTLQQDLAASVRPGLDYRQLHLQAHHRIAGLLADSGVIRVSPEEAVASGLSTVFFPHGLGHYIGLQVHDVAGLIDNDGNALPRPDGHPFLRLTRVLEPGNVLTIEPGLYIIDSLLQQWRAANGDNAIDWHAVDRLRPCGGIRIEDNVLVTTDGSVNLTRECGLA